MKAVIWNHDIAIEPEKLEVAFGFMCQCRAPVIIDGIPATISIAFDPSNDAKELHACYDQSNIVNIIIQPSIKWDTIYNGHCVECEADIPIAMRKTDE